MAIDYINSFYLFETKFGVGKTYKDYNIENSLPLDTLPEFYTKKLQEEGYLKYYQSFWHFVQPEEFKEELQDYLDLYDLYPIIKNAFGCFIILYENEYYYMNIHLNNFGLLSEKLGIVLNSTLTNDYALRNMFFMDLFEDALNNLGEVNYDEIYTFTPALKMGGEVNSQSLAKVKLREHIHFLSQL